MCSVKKKTHNSSNKYENTGTVTNKMLEHSWLKFTGMLLFTVYVVTCIKTSNADCIND